MNAPGLWATIALQSWKPCKYFPLPVNSKTQWKKVNFLWQKGFSLLHNKYTCIWVEEKKRRDKVTHQPFLAPETQTVKKDTLWAQHASVFLLYFCGISAFNQPSLGLQGARLFRNNFKPVLICMRIASPLSASFFWIFVIWDISAYIFKTVLQMQSKVLGSPLLAVKESTAHTKQQHHSWKERGKECRGLLAEEDRSTCQPQTLSIFILVGSNLCEGTKMWVTLHF